MRKTKLPIVDWCVTRNEAIRVGSNEWYSWLTVNRNFRYCPNPESWMLLYDITVLNRADGYWCAYRKVNGKLRQKYLGKQEDIDIDMLQNAARELSVGDVEYRQLKRDRKQQKIEARKSNGL
jgi:hypothetical protein